MENKLLRILGFKKCICEKTIHKLLSNKVKFTDCPKVLVGYIDYLCEFYFIR